MVDKSIWEAFNSLKKQGWDSRTKEEWENVKTQIREWLLGLKTSLSETDYAYLKDKVCEQVKTIDDKKNQFFEKQGNRPSIHKDTYIFREDEGKAFVKLATALAAYLDRH